MARKEGIVLYVEDEESDRFLMRRAFAKEGLEAVLQTVCDGRAAINYVSGTEAYADRMVYPPPAVVLLDLNLPEIHGFEVLQWIRAQPAHNRLPIVVFTSSPRPEDRTRAKSLGADDFLQKPGSVAGFQEVARGLCVRWLGGNEEGNGAVVGGTAAGANGFGGNPATRATPPAQPGKCS